MIIPRPSSQNYMEKSRETQEHQKETSQNPNKMLQSRDLLSHRFVKEKKNDVKSEAS